MRSTRTDMGTVCGQRHCQGNLLRRPSRRAHGYVFTWCCAIWTRRAHDLHVHVRPHTQWHCKHVHAVHCDLPGQQCFHSTFVVSPRKLRCRSCTPSPLLGQVCRCCDQLHGGAWFRCAAWFNAAARDMFNGYMVGPVKNCGPPLAVSAATPISDVACVMWPNQVECQCRDG